MSYDDRQNQKGDDAVVSMVEKGAEYAKQMLEESEKLRAQLHDRREASLTGDPAEPRAPRSSLIELSRKIAALEAEKKEILDRLSSVEEENQQFATRYVQIEEENNNLANLYVASHQLHSTLNPSEVLRVIIEIVINLIGAEVLCVYILDDRDGKQILEPVGAEGANLSAFSKIKFGSGAVGESVITGEVTTSEGAATPSEHPENDPPVVVIPLRVGNRPVGVIAIHSLFRQKDGFSPLDYELFTLLAAHAATAIFAARLHSQSERKLNTIQGFIDLLTK